MDVSTMLDILGLYQCLTAAIEIKEKVASIGVSSAVPIVERVPEAFLSTPDERSPRPSTRTCEHSRFTSLKSSVLPILKLTQIDFDFSRDENRVCIRPGIDDELDLWRADYACE